jgi:AcrR family transcriptional regulator
VQVVRVNTPLGFDGRMKVLRSMDACLDDTPIDRITVGDICGRAGISRPTFYRYFKDKYAVAHWYADYASSEGIYQTGRSLNWYDANLVTTQIFLDIKSFMSKVALSEDYNSIASYGRRRRRETLIETIVDYKHEKLTDELRFQVRYYALAETSAMRDWYIYSQEDSAEHISRLLESIVPGDLYRLLDSPTK